MSEMRGLEMLLDQQTVKREKRGTGEMYRAPFPRGKDKKMNTEMHTHTRRRSAALVCAVCGVNERSAAAGGCRQSIK
jgi:hypothetical protein